VTADERRRKLVDGTYGENLPEIAERIEAIVEGVFRDSAGFVRGAVNLNTLKPFTHADVERYPLAEMYTRNANIPWKLKKLIMNYEEADMATGDYLMALVHQAAAADDREIRRQARGVFEAICALCDNAAATNSLGPGWLPKPYGGIRDVSEMCETSADQYTKITLALELYARELANKRERDKAHRLIVSFADWWIEHWYTTSYFGRCLWWWRHNSPHGTGWLLYILALAEDITGEPLYGREFELLWEFREGLLNVSGPSGNSMNLGVETAVRLWDLKPDHREFWEQAMIANWDAVRALAAPEGYVVQGSPDHRITMNTGPRVACSAAAILPWLDDADGTATWARDYMSRQSRAEMFLVDHPDTEHVRPGFWFHENALSGHYFTAWLHAHYKLARYAPVQGEKR